MESPGKVAVITGAGSGIGRASAVALASAEFAVVLAGRRPEMLEETAALVGAADGAAEGHSGAEQASPRSLVVPTDVSDPASITALFDRVRSTYGRIDLLFNNAGISTRGIPFED